MLVSAGKYLMGDEQGAADEKPRRAVELSSFWMDRTEVTQEAFEKLMGYNPSKIVREKYPVDSVRWLEAAEYCNERSRHDGFAPCYDLKTGACDFTANGYRLPTEAEWEYACRAGTTTKYFFGDNAAALDSFGWYEKNAGKKAHPAGTKKPNSRGLCDLAGSLIEWCNDWYAPDSYSKNPATNPSGPAAGKERVLRGGCWQMKAEHCRSGIRFHDEPALPDACFGRDSYGFRCVRKAEEKK